MFAEALAEEVARHGIRVCALCPGPTESEFHAVAGAPEEGRKGRVPVGPVVDAALRGLDSGKYMRDSGYEESMAGASATAGSAAVCERGGRADAAASAFAGELAADKRG